LNPRLGQPMIRLLFYLLLGFQGVVCHAQPVDNARLEALRARIERLKNDITQAEESRNEARDQLRESEEKISDASRLLRELSRQREAARKELDTLAAQRRAIESDISGRQDQLSRLITVRYLTGETGTVRLLLSGEHPARAARELHYYGYMSRAQAEFIRVLRSGLANLRVLEELSRGKAAELSGIEGAHRREREGLVRQQAERRQVLGRVSERLRTQRREVRSLERDESRLSRLVEELARALADTLAEGKPAKSKPGGRRIELLPEAADRESAFARLKGKLRLPVKGELIHRFGGPRTEGGPPWKGLFIRAASGQEVKAVASGQVVFADWMRGFGNLLIIDHGQGYLTIYGNNESVLKGLGDAVRVGDVVATVGASGGNPESGLYFEMRHEGKVFDPLKWAALK